LIKVVDGFDSCTGVLVNGTDVRGCFEMDPIPNVAGVCLMIGSAFGAGAGCLVNPAKPAKGFEEFEADIEPKELKVGLAGVSESRLNLG
jgi:hypothetical protein